MDDMLIDRLLEDLKQPDEDIREQATTELWQLWFRQKGEYGLEILKESQEHLENGDFSGAEAILTDLIADQPDFAEAWNRRAVLRYILGDYKKSLVDCQRTVELNPLHFGAFHGMGLCHAALGNYREAIKAFRRTLDIQPHDLLNQRLILECTARLS
ncbi:tetratricopeptide repeat protein [Egbenema bharatensis]|uniref:tetratricopeptide repeat protein n=1 Tax=Egbenema bharatensis TaxID=3463334 RepID=UPI003A8B1A1F